MQESERIIDEGAGPGAQGVCIPAVPPVYVVADGDGAEAVAARFGVDPAVLLDVDGSPLHVSPTGARRDLVPGEPLFIGRAPSDTANPPGGEDADVPPPHPAFLRAFPSPFYADDADEFAPFGTDEGAEARWSILVEGPGVGAGTSLRQLLRQELGDEGAVAALEGSDESIAAELDPVVVGVAFTLLWATGRIDDAGGEQLLAAIERQIDRYGDDPRLVRMRADVAARCR